jgi:hypothetical protein
LTVIFLYLHNKKTRNGGQLMTRKQLTDPFGSDDEEETKTSSPSSEEKTKERSESSPRKRYEPSDKIQRDSQVPSLLILASPTSIEAPTVAPTPTRDAKSEDLKRRAQKLLEQTKREAVAAAAASSTSSPVRSLSKQGSQV